jgi:hypothetical protein
VHFFLVSVSCTDFIGTHSFKDLTVDELTSLTAGSMPYFSAPVFATIDDKVARVIPVSAWNAINTFQANFLQRDKINNMPQNIEEALFHHGSKLDFFEHRFGGVIDYIFHCFVVGYAACFFWKIWTDCMYHLIIVKLIPGSISLCGIIFRAVISLLVEYLKTTHLYFMELGFMKDFWIGLDYVMELCRFISQKLQQLATKAMGLVSGFFGIFKSLLGSAQPAAK